MCVGKEGELAIAAVVYTTESRGRKKYITKSRVDELELRVEIDVVRTHILNWRGAAAKLLRPPFLWLAGQAVVGA